MRPTKCNTRLLSGAPSAPCPQEPRRSGVSNRVRWGRRTAEEFRDRSLHLLQQAGEHFDVWICPPRSAQKPKNSRRHVQRDIFDSGQCAEARVSPWFESPHFPCAARITTLGCGTKQRRGGTEGSRMKVGHDGGSAGGLASPVSRLLQFLPIKWLILTAPRRKSFVFAGRFAFY